MTRASRPLLYPPNIGCGAILGAAVAFGLAPKLQVRLGSAFGFSKSSLPPALVMVGLGAALGAFITRQREKRRKF